MAGKKKSEKFTIHPFAILPVSSLTSFGDGGNFLLDNPNLLSSGIQAGTTLASGIIDNTVGGDDNRSNVVGKSAAMGALDMAGQLGQLGSAFGLPGTLIGTGVGALAGGIMGAENAKDNLGKVYAEGTQGLRAYGGQVNAELGGDINMVNGPRHEQGGVPINGSVEVEGGEAIVGNEVLSDRLINPETGNTFAEDAEKVKNKYKDRKHDGPAMKAQAAEISRLVELNNVVRAQKEQEDAIFQAEAKAYGGYIKMADGGKIEIQPGMEQFLGEIAGIRNMGVEEYASKLLAYGGGIENVPELKTKTASPLQTSVDASGLDVLSLGMPENLKGKNYHYDANTGTYTKTFGDKVMNILDLVKPKTPGVTGTEKGAYTFAAGGNMADPPPYSDQLKEYNEALSGLSSPSRGDLVDPTDPIYSSYSTSPTGLKLKNLYRSSASPSLYFPEYEAPVAPKANPITPTSLTPGGLPNLPSVDNELVDIKPEEFKFRSATEIWPSADAGKSPDFRLIPADEVAKRFGAGENDPALSPYWSSTPGEPGSLNTPGVEGSQFDPARVIRHTDPRQKALGGPLDNKLRFNPSGSVFGEDLLGASNPINMPAYSDPNQVTLTDKTYGDLFPSYTVDPLPTRGLTPVDNPSAVTPGLEKNPGLVDTSSLMLGTPQAEKDKMTFGNEEAALIASSLPGIQNMIRSFRPEETIYKTFTPEEINLAAARDAIDREASKAKRIHASNVRGSAKSSGEALSALSTGASAITEGAMDAKMQSFLNEETANTQIRNAAKQANVQIENAQIETNMQNEALAKGLGNQALADIGTNVQGYLKDKKLTKQNIKQNEQILSVINAISPNYKWESDNGKWALEFVKVMSNLPQTSSNGGK